MILINLIRNLKIIFVLINFTYALYSLMEVCILITNNNFKTNSNGTTCGKQKKARSLTTADIPDIVTAVVESLPQRGALTPASAQIDQRTTRKAATRTSRTAEKSSQSSRHQSPGSRGLNREVSPSSEPEDNSDEDADNEEFGKSNRIQCGNIA